MGKSADYKEDRWYAQQRREQVGKAYVREWRGHKAAADAMIQNYGRTNDSDELVSDDSDRHRKVLAELTAWNTSNGRNADNGADYGGVDMDHGLMPPDAAPFALGLLRNCSPPPGGTCCCSGSSWRRSRLCSALRPSPSGLPGRARWLRRAGRRRPTLPRRGKGRGPTDWRTWRCRWWCWSVSSTSRSCRAGGSTRGP